MNYDFKCTKCGNEEVKNIAMDEYSELKDKQVCSKCGEKMERVLEFSGSIGLCNGMYGTNNGGWNA